MTETTTEQAQDAINSLADKGPVLASRLLGVMLLAQAEMLQGITITSRTGMSAAVSIELAQHMHALGSFLAGGYGQAVIYDRVRALSSMVVSTIMGGSALEELGVNVSGAMDVPEDSDLTGILREVLDQLRANIFDPNTSVPELLDPLLPGFVGDAPEDPALVTT